MNTNGWLVSPAFARVVIFAVLSVGIWVGTIAADVSNKADKIDVATQTQILVSIVKTLDEIKISVGSLDKQQREIATDVAVLKAKAEAEDK